MEEEKVMMEKNMEDEFALKREMIVKWLSMGLQTEDHTSFQQTLQYQSPKVSPHYCQLMELRSVGVYFYHLEDILRRASPTLSLPEKQ